MTTNRYRDKHPVRDTFTKILLEIKTDVNCLHCGEDHPAVLDFHHPDPTDKEFTISTFAFNNTPTDENVRKLKREISKCEVLCSNCHRKEHYRLRQK